MKLLKCFMYIKYTLNVFFASLLLEKAPGHATVNTYLDFGIYYLILASMNLLLIEPLCNHLFIQFRQTDGSVLNLCLEI